MDIQINKVILDPDVRLADQDQPVLQMVDDYLLNNYWDQKIPVNLFDILERAGWKFNTTLPTKIPVSRTRGFYTYPDRKLICCTHRVFKHRQEFPVQVDIARAIQLAFQGIAIQHRYPLTSTVANTEPLLDWNDIDLSDRNSQYVRDTKLALHILVPKTIVDPIAVRHCSGAYSSYNTSFQHLKAFFAPKKKGEKYKPFFEYPDDKALHHRLKRTIHKLSKYN